MKSFRFKKGDWVRVVDPGGLIQINKEDNEVNNQIASYIESGLPLQVVGSLDKSSLIRVRLDSIVPVYMDLARTVLERYPIKDSLTIKLQNQLHVLEHFSEVHLESDKKIIEALTRALTANLYLKYRGIL